MVESGLHLGFLRIYTAIRIHVLIYVIRKLYNLQLTEQLYIQFSCNTLGPQLLAFQLMF